MSVVQAADRRQDGLGPRQSAAEDWRPPDLHHGLAVMSALSVPAPETWVPPVRPRQSAAYLSGNDPHGCCNSCRWCSAEDTRREAVRGLRDLLDGRPPRHLHWGAWAMPYVRDVKAQKYLVLALRDGPWCAYCPKVLALHEVTFDHVLPRSRGGSNRPENAALACLSCNCRKGDRTPEEWIGTWAS